MKKNSSFLVEADPLLSPTPTPTTSDTTTSRKSSWLIDLPGSGDLPSGIGTHSTTTSVQSKTVAATGGSLIDQLKNFMGGTNWFLDWDPTSGENGANKTLSFSSITAAPVLTAPVVMEPVAPTVMLAQPTGLLAFEHFTALP